MSHQQQFDNLPDDYLDQMLSSLPSWNDFATPTEQHLAVHLDEDSESSAMIMHQISSNGIMSTPMPLPAATPTCQNISGLERSIHGLYNGFAESQQFLPTHQGVQWSNGSAPRQRVRARRGQATDPHSIAERLRRERIAERMKRLQELVPNAYKTDKASMIDEIIDYVKFLQLQVKVLSVSRLGGPAAVAPLLAKAECGDAIGLASRVSGGDEDASLTMTEQQVAKLMEEDMGSAMQYLQGKGLCLMPISFANAISTATSHSHSQPQ